MNETLKTIYHRRSIRGYQSRQIDEQTIEEIVKAGPMAPSGMNAQRWHFTVIQNQALLDEMVAAAVDHILKSGNEFMIERVKNPTFHTFYHAPTVVLITVPAEPAISAADAAMAAQNICLAADSFSVGSCMIASSALIFDSAKGPEFYQRLGVPEGHKHFCTISLGYADGEYPPAPERKEDVIHYIK